tara:strand:+ start:3922 stop:4359 length:438 start_codon:yes stop_codon:yes gene_type:complete
MSALETQTKKIYEPRFNPETNKYEDHLPWDSPYLRNKPVITCPCTMYDFNSKTSYTQHIKRTTHEKWLDNYKVPDESDELKKEIKDLRIDNGKLVKEITKLKNKLSKKNIEIERVQAEIGSLKKKNEQLVNEGYYSCTSDEEEMD